MATIRTGLDRANQSSTSRQVDPPAQSQPQPLIFENTFSNHPLQHPPGSSAAARLRQSPPPSGTTMTMSRTAWAKVNSVQYSIVTNIASQLDFDGLGHVIWGSKPVFHLEASEEEGVWQEVKTILQGLRIKSNFQLIELASNSKLTKEEQAGYLINRNNLLKTIDQNKPFFAHKFGISERNQSKAILDNCVIPHLQGLSNNNFSGEQEFLAVTLGYGLSNANAAVDSANTSVHTDQVSQQVKNWMVARGQQKDSAYPLPKIPPFMQYPSAESQALVNQYLKDSDDIHTGLTNLQEKHEDLADEEDMDLGDAKIFVAAFVTSIAST